VELFFGDEWISVDLPDAARLVKPVSGVPLKPVEDPGSAIWEALRKPLEAKPLRELVKPSWKITIASDDPTVPCYAPVWETAITIILEELRKAGVSKSQTMLL